MSKDRKRIAVIFGGQSVEHDVSILTGLQFLEAMDLDRFEGLPVYVAPDGGWWTGEALLKRSFYPLSEDKKKNLLAVRLDVGASRGRGAALVVAKGGLFGAKKEQISFDLMVPAIHGSNGEDGTLQGLLAFHGVPFAGCRALASSTTMDKDFTKRVLGAIGLPVLPGARIERPQGGSASLEPKAMERQLAEGLGSVEFPLFVKPLRLGSSIGASVADDMDGLLAALLAVFRIDTAALVEPQVANLREYNVAASRATGTLRLSAIERPERTADFLGFGEKYLSGGSRGAKLDEAPSEGMLSQNRVLNPPELTAKQKEDIEECAWRAFDKFQLAGSVRIDFLSDAESGELWFNEINTVPGSFAFYLWQAAEPPLSFIELTTALIEEGLRLSANDRALTDVETGRAVIFDRG